jgi:dipeptidyl aminopeptidase/acylaminoacyl peptidase
VARLVVGDGTVFECSAPPLPRYEEWVAEFEPFVAREHEWSGLGAEFSRQPLTSIFRREEFERLELAAAEGRCVRLIYSSGGLRIPAYVVSPRSSGSRPPVVVFARGGNRDFGAIGPAALLDLLALAEAGYVVAASQYRGGPGAEGNDEFGGRDLGDLLVLVDLVRGRGDVDAERLFLWGVSRGGMMAALALRAGVVARAMALRAPIVDLAETAASRPDMRALFEELMPDYRADPEGALSRRSAINWLDEVRPPVLVMHGRQDVRIAVNQSERLAAGLRARGRPCELVVYERESHLLLLHRSDYLRAITHWFDRHAHTSHESPT